MVNLKKNCKKCQCTKRITEFYKKAENQDGYDNHCKACEQNIKQYLAKLKEAGLKLCASCKVEKPFADYDNNLDMREPFNRKCKNCQ